MATTDNSGQAGEVLSGLQARVSGDRTHHVTLDISIAVTFSLVVNVQHAITLQQKILFDVCDNWNGRGSCDEEFKNVSSLSELAPSVKKLYDFPTESGQWMRIVY